MKYIIKVFMHFALISSLILVTSAQNRYQNQRKSSHNEPAEQGRTLGVIRPLLGLALNSIARPFVGFDAPIVSAAPYKPSSTPGAGLSDPYYGNYGHANYGGYTPNYSLGYNYYGGYPLYKPTYAGYYPLPFYGGYRPGNYGIYPQYNGYGGQRPSYSNPIPRPTAGQTSNIYPSTATSSPATSGTTNPAPNSAQAAQIANFLGQLLGQQLRPLLNQGAASSAHDVPEELQGKRYRHRYYQL